MPSTMNITNNAFFVPVCATRPSMSSQLELFHSSAMCELSITINDVLTRINLLQHVGHSFRLM